MRGHFGAEMKFAGFDMIVVEGKAESPVILSVMDDRIKLIPAIEYWGRSTSVTEDMFRDSLNRERDLSRLYRAGWRAPSS